MSKLKIELATPHFRNVALNHLATMTVIVVKFKLLPYHGGLKRQVWKARVAGLIIF